MLLMNESLHSPVSLLDPLPRCLTILLSYLLTQAVIKVPLDAYKMDFVFSDVESGDGIYDSRGGYDYHLPVEDSPVGAKRGGMHAWGPGGAIDHALTSDVNSLLRPKSPASMLRILLLRWPPSQR